MGEKTRIVRFTPLQRLFHGLLVLMFLVQAASGMARMYIEVPFGKRLAWMFGGYEGARTVHKYVGILLICCFLVHIIYILIRLDWKSLRGPDSLLPSGRDAREFLQHAGWFFGLSRHPRFDRWGYWEKFDYWAVFWGVPILGITGLLLAYPIAASAIIPGWGLNLAFWIHRIEALLAMCHIFIIHFFIAHLRRRHFPMDLAMFEGSVNLNEAREERPEWVARLEESGRLEEVPAASAGRRSLFYIFGFSALAVGLFLLVGGILNSPFITW